MMFMSFLLMKNSNGSISGLYDDHLCWLPKMMLRIQDWDMQAFRCLLKYRFLSRSPKGSASTDPGLSPETCISANIHPG